MMELACCFSLNHNVKKVIYSIMILLKQMNTWVFEYLYRRNIMHIKLSDIRQYKIYDYNRYSHMLNVGICIHDKIEGRITGNYREILNIGKMREICGYDKVPDIPQTQFKEIKLAFDEELRTVETQDVYLYQGWEEQRRYYLLGNYRITKNNVVEVINKSSHSRFKLGAMPDDEMLYQHMITRYFRLLKHDVYSKILLCISLLAMFTTPLQETEYQPQFATYVKARFNKGKSSSAKALINPWNGVTFSFEDTEAVLKQAMKIYRDILLLIDDMSKAKRPGMINKNERIIRMSGDTTTSALKMVGGKIDDSAVGCMTLITGEDLPQLQDSSYTRMLILDYEDDEVDWDILTGLQENTSLTAWFYIKFLQYSMDKEDFIENLTDSFINFRSQYRKKFKQHNISNRYVDMCSWILAMWDEVNNFFQSANEPLEEDTFIPECEALILKQGLKYSHKSPSQLFLSALFSLIENNRLNIVSLAEAKGGVSFDLFEQNNMYFVRSGAVYDKIKAYYDSRNMDFYDSERAVRRDLDSCGLIHKTRNYTTTEFKDANNHSVSGFYLLANNAKDMMEQKGGNIDEHI